MYYTMWERAQKHERKSKVQLPWGASSILCLYDITQGAPDATGAPYESILAAGILLPVYYSKNQGVCTVCLGREEDTKQSSKWRY